MRNGLQEYVGPSVSLKPGYNSYDGSSGGDPENRPHIFVTALGIESGEVYGGRYLGNYLARKPQTLYQPLTIPVGKGNQAIGISPEKPLADRIRFQ